MMRTCPKCNQSKPEEAYCRDRNSCRTCYNRHKRTYRTGKEEGAIGKVCTQCKEWKPIESFHADKVKEDGKASHCRVCHRRYNRERDEYRRAERRRSEVECGVIMTGLNMNRPIFTTEEKIDLLQRELAWMEQEGIEEYNWIDRETREKALAGLLEDQARKENRKAEGLRKAA